MRRRALLAAIATAGTVSAGCLGDDTDPNAGGTTTPTPSDAGTNDPATATDETATPTAVDGEVTVENLALQQGLVVPNTPDSIAVQRGDHRHLWATVSVSGTPPEIGAFALDVGSTVYAPLSADDHRAYRTGWGDEQYYDASTGTSLLLFELPTQVDDPDVTLRSPVSTAFVADSLEERLAATPPSTSATLVKRYDETPDRPVAVEVTNEGDITTRFVAAVNREGPAIAYTPVTRVSVLLAPGETRTIPVHDPINHRTPSPDGDGEPDMTYHLDWADGDDTATFGG